MFFRADSKCEAQELAEGLLHQLRNGPKASIRFEGGPFDGKELELSRSEIDRGMMASSGPGSKSGVYQRSDQPNVWRYTPR